MWDENILSDMQLRLFKVHILTYILLYVVYINANAPYTYTYKLMYIIEIEIDNKSVSSLLMSKVYKLNQVPSHTIFI